MKRILKRSTERETTTTTGKKRDESEIAGEKEEKN